MKSLLLFITFILQGLLHDDEAAWRRAKIESYRRAVASRVEVAAETESVPVEASGEGQELVEADSQPQAVQLELFLPSGQPLPPAAAKFLVEKAGPSPVLVLVEWNSPKCRHADFRLRVRLQDGEMLARDWVGDQGIVVHGEGFELAVVSSKELVADAQYTMFSHEVGHATFHTLAVENSEGSGPWRLVHEMDFSRQANNDVRTVQQIPGFRVE